MYYYKAYELVVKEQVVEMTINGSWIQDIAHVLIINKNLTISALIKTKNIVQVNWAFIPLENVRI